MNYLFSTFIAQKAPPSINKGVISQAAMALISNAAGTKISLLINDPLATPTPQPTLDQHARQ